ncbi:MAG: hypothetical protein GDA38_00050 [Hormoscilla sp. SP12CHS1]|nr:hypothetical protein [Hormoscilla sp. SP12CHS1]
MTLSSPLLSEVMMAVTGGVCIWVRSGVLTASSLVPIALGASCCTVTSYLGDRTREFSLLS